MSRELKKKNQLRKKTSEFLSNSLYFCLSLLLIIYCITEIIRLLTINDHNILYWIFLVLCSIVCLVAIVILGKQLLVDLFKWHRHEQLSEKETSEPSSGDDQ